MNGQYMRELSPDELQRRLERFYDRELPREIVEISQEKMQTLKDFEDLAGPLRRAHGVRRQGVGAVGEIAASASRA